MSERIEASEYAERRRALVAAVADGGGVPIVVGPGADAHYLTGEPYRLNDRPVILVTDVTGVTLVAPLLEADEFHGLPDDIRVVAWPDGEDVVDVVSAVLGGATRVAVADGMPFWVVDALRARHGALTSAAGVLRPMREKKSPRELELMALASRAADLAYDGLGTHRLEGLREREVAALLADLLVDFGCDPGTGGALVASGPHAAAPHHAAGERVLERGDPVIIDFGGRIDGYCSDTSRTFCIGEPSYELARIHAIVLEANRAAFSLVAPGVVIEDVDARAREVIAGHGLEHAFLHRTGHGIGIEVHEHPYAVSGDRTVLEPGMTFTIEPGIYLPEVGGVRIEDIVQVTSDGAVSLNDSSRELLRLS